MPTPGKARVAASVATALAQNALGKIAIMQTPLNASASTAGALMSSSTFMVPQFQREYSWQEDEVADFWNDLSESLDQEAYFLGLVILTDEGSRKHVVDGQQRLITLSLLANALYHEASTRGRAALAERIRADFLFSIDYDTDATHPRVILSHQGDNLTFQHILAGGKVPTPARDDGTVSFRLARSYRYFIERLQQDLASDPFKRLGKWTDFLTNRLYFAVFVHPDPAAAYQVFEVINTRGRELTTADLLKNYILSQTQPANVDNVYDLWQFLSKNFQPDGNNTFVQFIRHVVTTVSGHILPKDLFGFLAQRNITGSRRPPTPPVLMDMLASRLPLYLQMMDTTAPGPAESEALRIFAALNSLNVIAVRPILLAMAETPDPIEGMKYILRLVVRRIIVGNLGTGNVERRFGEAARRVREENQWTAAIRQLEDLNPPRDAFVDQLHKRSFNKSVLAFMRRSIIENTITPNSDGVLHQIWIRQATSWVGMTAQEGTFWASTIGNTVLSNLERRPREASDWDSVKTHIIGQALPHEWRARLEAEHVWDARAVDAIGQELAQRAGEIWY